MQRSSFSPLVERVFANDVVSGRDADELD